MTTPSVIIPVLNGGSLLVEQLEGLAAQEFVGTWELIVADNGSSDGSAARARSFEDRIPGLRVVDASARRGQSFARNQAAAQANGDFLLFVDADDVVRPGWLQSMATAAEQAEMVAGDLDHGDFLPRGCVPAGRLRTSGLIGWPGFLPFASGANCGVRADLFRSLGGFDEAFRYGCEDVDLSWRVQLAGHTITHVPDAVVAYRERLGARELWRQFFRYGKQEVRLASRFRGQGMPPRGVVQGVRTAAGLVLRSPISLQQCATRREWVASAARRAGRVAGSIELRTVYL